MAIVGAVVVHAQPPAAARAWQIGPVAPRNAPSKAVEPGRPFEVHVGDEVTIADRSLRMTFEQVVEDSRCPVDVTCIWAGDAVIRVRVDAGPNRTSILQVHTNPPNDDDLRVGEYRVRLVSLSPRPIGAEGPGPGNTVATLVIERPSAK